MWISQESPFISWKPSSTHVSVFVRFCCDALPICIMRAGIIVVSDIRSSDVICHLASIFDRT